MSTRRSAKTAKPRRLPSLAMLRRRAARKAVAVAAIGWVVHLVILALIVEFGDDSPYYGFGIEWRPGWIEVAVLTAVTLPFVGRYLRKPDRRTRSALVVPAILHLPFIAFGLWVSVIYFANVKEANEESAGTRNREALRED